MVQISVIMGIYNCESTLQEALDSLYAQMYQDFEIVLCDDGSVDGTYELALKNQREHSNILLLKNDVNKGLNHTLNRCLQASHGKYIARMDGDDISLPERFFIEKDFLDNHNEFAIVSSPMIYFDEEGTFGIGRGKGQIVESDFLKGSPICHAPCMVRREAYLAVSGYSEDVKLLRVEDYHLWFKMYAAGYKAYMLNTPLYKMRDDRNAIKRRTWRNRLNECYVKRIGFKMLKMPLYSYVFVLRPLLVGLLPKWLYEILHKYKHL